RPGLDEEVALVLDDVADRAEGHLVAHDREDPERYRPVLAQRRNLPENTCRAGPVIFTRELERSTLTRSTPPGSRTCTSRPAAAQPWSTPTTTVAQAPVPHASVIPTPRSHTTRSISESDRGVANSTLVPAGNRACVAMRGPKASICARVTGRRVI